MPAVSPMPWYTVSPGQRDVYKKIVNRLVELKKKEDKATCKRDTAMLHNKF